MEAPRTTSEGSAYALVIGIGAYRDERVRPLTFTHADARAFADLLSDPERCGLPPENVRLMLDDEATLFNIKNGISGWLYQNATSECTVFVFFAGHGGVESDRTGLEPDGTAKYLLPWDANVDNLFASALSNAEFHHLLNTIRARRLVIFMDACYAGGVAQRGARDLAIIANPYERLAEGEGRLVIAASKPNQRSWEDESLGHGIFSYHLIEALSGAADTNQDGCVSIMDVYRFLERNVPRSARKLSRSDQEPLLCGNIASDIVLAVNREQIRRAQQRARDDERRQSEEGRRRRGKLFELYDAGRLGMDLYRDSLHLMDSDPESLSPVDRTLLEYLVAMLDERIDPSLFVQTWLMIDRSPPVVEKPSDPVPRANLSARDVKPAASRFCFGCGRTLIPDRRFCTSCGRPVPEDQQRSGSSPSAGGASRPQA
jgi:uncharacterized caspase-like protein